MTNSTQFLFMNQPVYSSTALHERTLRIVLSSYIPVLLLLPGRENFSISFKVFKKFQRNFLKCKNNLAQFSNFKVCLLFFLWQLPLFLYLTLSYRSESFWFCIRHLKTFKLRPRPKKCWSVEMLEQVGIRSMSEEIQNYSELVCSSYSIATHSGQRPISYWSSQRVSASRAATGINLSKVPMAIPRFIILEDANPESESQRE